MWYRSLALRVCIKCEFWVRERAPRQKLTVRKLAGLNAAECSIPSTVLSLVIHLFARRVCCVEIRSSSERGLCSSRLSVTARCRLSTPPHDEMNRKGICVQCSTTQKRNEGQRERERGVEGARRLCENEGD
jgi:hypothetical protein